jgi:hypothetical protein
LLWLLTMQQVSVRGNHCCNVTACIITQTAVYAMPAEA